MWTLERFSCQVRLTPNTSFTAVLGRKQLSVAGELLTCMRMLYKVVVSSHDMIRNNHVQSLLLFGYLAALYHLRRLYVNLQYWKTRFNEGAEINSDIKQIP